MNTGIQDAHNLAWKLAAVVRGDAHDALLDSYESERRPIAEHVLALSNTRLAATLASNAIPVNRDASTIQLDLGYRSSALVHDDRGPEAPLRAGDRAPDARLVTAHGPRRLLELTGGGRFTLLAFGGAGGVEDLEPAVTTLHVVPDVTRDDEIADPSGGLLSAYGAAASTLVLIRPDGYIGFISDSGDVSGVVDYLSTVLA